MAVNIFDEDAEKLPHVAAAGDIIQLHRVTVFPDSILRVLRYFPVVFWSWLLYTHLDYSNSKMFTFSSVHNKTREALTLTLH